MKKQKTKILFLYTELAQYFISSVNFFTKYNIDKEIHIIRWKVNKEAPFEFQIENNIYLYDRDNFTKEELLNFTKKLNPSVIVCSGWIDKIYLSISKHFFKKIPTVLMFDNQWTGNIKQKIATFISPVFLLNKFSHAWVVGESQKLYAQKLGFHKDKIQTGFYCADVDFFIKKFKKNQDFKEKKFPKRFIFIGRYIEQKGIFDLWKAFLKIENQIDKEWELWCLGTGELFNQKIEHQKIKHFGFVQSHDLEYFIKNTGILILPSHFEPWGVVIHEFASAGFPLICSNKVGSANQFLENNKNGFVHQAKNVDDLAEKMLKMSQLSNKDLQEMSQFSIEKAKEINYKKWNSSLNLFIKEKL